jgi:hypothetical protein
MTYKIWFTYRPLRRPQQARSRLRRVVYSYWLRRWIGIVRGVAWNWYAGLQRWRMGR